MFWIYDCCTYIRMLDMQLLYIYYVLSSVSLSYCMYTVPNGPCRSPRRSPRRLVPSLPMCSVGQGHLSLSLLPSNNQYKWDHLDLKQRRSVCVLYTCMDVGVLVSGCGCSLLPSTSSFQFEVRMELGSGLKTS